LFKKILTPLFIKYKFNKLNKCKNQPRQVILTGKFQFRKQDKPFLENIGKKIKALRRENRMTLQQLGDESGLTASYISQIERDQTSPSIASLKKIAEAFNVRIVDFFVGGSEEEPVVMAPGERLRVSLKGWRAHIQQLVKTVSGKRMQPFHTVIEPGGGSRDPYSHAGEEFGIILEGNLTLTVGEKVYSVPEGHSFYYSSLIPHSWTNKGKTRTVVVWVVSPPSW
jgi:transcriptional regulator with XRE-family HTH domain